MKTIIKIPLAIIFTIAASYLIVSLILQNNNNTISLNQISDTHYEYVLRAMMDLKPEYIEQINEITFSGNQTWIAEECKSENKLIYKSESYLGGCQYGRTNRIFIYVSKSEKEFRGTLCHEILHEIMELGGDEEEDIAYMIDDSGICYRDKPFDLKVEIQDYNINENSTIKIEEEGFLRTRNITFSSSLEIITFNSSLENEN